MEKDSRAMNFRLHSQFGETSRIVWQSLSVFSLIRVWVRARYQKMTVHQSCAQRRQVGYRVAVYVKAAKYWNTDEMALRLPRVSSVGDEVMSCARNICLLLVCGLQGPRASTQGLRTSFSAEKQIPRPLFRRCHRFTGAVKSLHLN